MVIKQVNATEAKNRFGELLTSVAVNAAVSLIKHGKAAAYIISAEDFERLISAGKTNPSALERLERDFEAMVASMQEPDSINAMKGLMTIDTASLRAELVKHSTAAEAPVGR